MDRARARAAQQLPPADTTPWSSRTATTRAEPTHLRFLNTQAHRLDRRQRLPERARVRAAWTRWFSCTSDVGPGDRDRTLRDFVVAGRVSPRAGGRAEVLR